MPPGRRAACESIASGTHKKRPPIDTAGEEGETGSIESSVSVEARPARRRSAAGRRPWLLAIEPFGGFEYAAVDPYFGNIAKEQVAGVVLGAVHADRPRPAGRGEQPLLGCLG